MNLSLPQDPSDRTDHNQLHTCPPTTHNTRPASPFFRHRPLGRAPSPPTWACYEQIPARSDLLGSSDSDSESDSGEAADEDSLSDADSSSSSSASSDEEHDEEHEDPPHPGTGTDAGALQPAGLMDVESDNEEDAGSARSHRHPASGDPEKRDKGKQRADNPPNTVSGVGKSVPVSHSRSRRPRGRRPPVSVLRPILTIQRSQGFVWNQDLFVPPYIKDRYVASTSPPTSYGPFSACGSTSTPTPLGDYEIEVVEIRVRDGELNDIIP